MLALDGVSDDTRSGMITWGPGFVLTEPATANAAVASKGIETAARRRETRRVRMCGTPVSGGGGVSCSSSASPGHDDQWSMVLRPCRHQVRPVAAGDLGMAAQPALQGVDAVLRVDRVLGVDRRLVGGVGRQLGQAG